MFKTTNTKKNVKMTDGKENMTETQKKFDDIFSDLSLLNKEIEKLEYYENLEKKGLLKIFPCKVGDTLYSLENENVIEAEVLSVEYQCEAENHGVFIRERITINNDIEGFSKKIDFSEIGKTVFLTPEEAEEKLKKIEKTSDREY